MEIFFPSIEAISIYLPESILTNEDLSSQFPEWSADKIASKLGISQRRISKKDEFVSDMAAKAANNLFDEYGIDRRNIDFILLCTQSPDYFLPTTACLVQDKLNLNTNCGALDMNLGCSGYVYGLSLAKGLLAMGDVNNVLLITADKYTKFINEKDKSNRSIFGDAATASLITNQGFLGKLGKFVFGTDGSGAENLIVKNGGIKNFEKKGFDICNGDDFISNDDNLFMNGEKIFEFTTQAVPNLVRDVLLKNNLAFSQIDLFIFHQANRFMLDYIRRKLKIPEDKFFVFMSETGNTVSSTIPIALKEALVSKRIEKGMKILIAGFGVGYSFSGSIIEY